VASPVTLWLTVILFALTYLGLALGKVPGLRVDRALVGATLMLVTGLLSLEQAVSTACIDYKTILLLFGMMVVVAYLRLSGFFTRLTEWVLDRIRSPLGLLAVTIALSGTLSAFLINDVVCVALTPLVLHLARRLNCNPVPHLLGLATAANIGSTGTITGNPQNIYIGSHSGISYARFAMRLLPVAALGLGVCFVVILLVYRRSLLRHDDSDCPAANGASEPSEVPRARAHVWLQRKAIAVTLVTIVLFFTGLPLELVALGAAAVLLMDRIKPEKVYRQIDWGLLVMFAGLFIVVHTFQIHVVSRWGIDGWSWVRERPIDLLSLVSAGLSNLVSNVPAVLLMEPLVQATHQESAWLALAMSSTLAGNLTVLGSVANLIVVENARREGVVVSLWDYSRVGIPVTVLTVLIGVLWLTWVNY